MPYPQLEELTSRRREKVALFLTAEQMAGVFAIGLPAYIATLQTTLWLRILILIAAAVLGVALTSEVHGMACWERAVCWARGQARRRMLGAVIRPAEFTAAPVVQDSRALPLGGPLRRVKASVPHLPRQPRLAGAVRTAALPRSPSHTARPAPELLAGARDHQENMQVRTDVGGAGFRRNDHGVPGDPAPAVVVEGSDDT